MILRREIRKDPRNMTQSSVRERPTLSEELCVSSVPPKSEQPNYVLSEWSVLIRIFVRISRPPRGLYVPFRWPSKQKSSSINRAFHSSASAIQHVRINHCRPYVFVAEQFLHCPYVVPALEQMSRKAVPQAVTTAVLGDARMTNRFLDRGLRSTIGEMMAPLGAASWVRRASNGGKDILP